MNHGDVHDGWEGHWIIPPVPEDEDAGRWWDLDEDTGILRTPIATPEDLRATQVRGHVITAKSYPKGFVMQIEFRFDACQVPLFPRDSVDDNNHRPTFLGNSGIGIYSWTDSEGIRQQLYEIQITDTNRMCPKESRNIPHEHRFLRLDFGDGPEFKGRGVQLSVGAGALADDFAHLDPDNAPLFKAALTGGADNLCALVAGLPVSIMEDVDITRDASGEHWPDDSFAMSSPVGDPRVVVNSPDEEDFEEFGGAKPIGGTEQPQQMFHEYRANYVPRDVNGFTHFNRPNSEHWNQLWLCFLPADWNAEKKRNAYFHSKVNEDQDYGGTIFNGEVKTGTRSSRKTSAQDPERNVYNPGEGGEPSVDKKIRILGHWGSSVEFRNVKIWAVGSE